MIYNRFFSSLHYRNTLYTNVQSPAACCSCHSSKANSSLTTCACVEILTRCFHITHLNHSKSKCNSYDVSPRILLKIYDVFGWLDCKLLSLYQCDNKDIEDISYLCYNDLKWLISFASTLGWHARMLDFTWPIQTTLKRLYYSWFRLPFHPYVPNFVRKFASSLRRSKVHCEIDKQVCIL